MSKEETDSSVYVWVLSSENVPDGVFSSAKLAMNQKSHANWEQVSDTWYRTTNLNGQWVVERYLVDKDCHRD